MIAEGDEMITLDISGVVNGQEYGTQVQDLTIIDDDIIYIGLTANTGAISEVS